MKKFILFLFFIFFSINIFCGIIALYDLEQNTNNSVSSQYNLYRQFNPTSDFYSNTITFSGNYSFYARKGGDNSSLGNNCQLLVDPDLNVLMSTKSRFTIFAHSFNYDREGAGQFDADAIFKKTGTYWMQIQIYTGNSGCGNDGLAWWNFINTISCVGTATYGQWVRYQIEFTGTQYKLYVNGELKGTLNNSNSLFTGSDLGFLYFNGNGVGAQGNYGWFDYAGVSDEIYNGGFPSLPTNTPTITNTFTVTPTFTITNTSTNTGTNTMTFTNTATYTNTPTNTFTATDTATNTPTFTITNTPTITPTPTYTFTPNPTLQLHPFEIFSYYRSKNVSIQRKR